MCSRTCKGGYCCKMSLPGCLVPQQLDEDDGRGANAQQHGAAVCKIFAPLCVGLKRRHDLFKHPASFEDLTG